MTLRLFRTFFVITNAFIKSKVEIIIYSHIGKLNSNAPSDQGPENQRASRVSGTQRICSHCFEVEDRISASIVSRLKL